MSEAAGSATDVAEGAVFHGLRIAECCQGFFSRVMSLMRIEQSGVRSEQGRAPESTKIVLTALFSIPKTREKEGGRASDI
jgi:hypothetical protein